MHYYQFNVGDYTSSTAHLEPMEDLAYRRMLDLYYSSEKALPDDTNKIARLIRMRSHCDCIATVLNDFFILEDEGWHCERADIEIFKFHEKSVKAAKSAKARWKKAKQKQKVKPPSEGNANALKTHSEGNANQEPLTTNQEPLTTNQREKEKKDLLLKSLADGMIQTGQYLQEFPEPELEQDAIEVINHLRVTKNPKSTLEPEKYEIELLIENWLLSDDLPKATLIKLINGAGSKDSEKEFLQVSYILKPKHRAKLLQLEESMPKSGSKRVPVEGENEFQYPADYDAENEIPI